MVDDGEDVQPGSGQSAGLEEVGGEDGVCLAVQESGPGEVVALGCGLDAVGFEDLPRGGGGDLDSQSGEFAVDSPVAPAWVFPDKAEDEGLDTADGGWAAWPFRAGCSGVVSAEKVAVPAQDGVGGDDQVELPRRWSGYRV